MSEYVLLEGKPPYRLRDLSGLYLYGMMNRIRSSRQLESAQTEWSMVSAPVDIGMVPRHRSEVAAILS